MVSIGLYHAGEIDPIKEITRLTIEWLSNRSKKYYLPRPFPSKAGQVWREWWSGILVEWWNVGISAGWRTVIGGYGGQESPLFALLFVPAINDGVIDKLRISVLGRFDCD